MAGNQRLNATITIGAAVQASLRRNLSLVSNGLDRVGDEIAEVTRRQRELDGQRRVLERQGQSVEELDREYQDLNRTLEQLRDRQARLQAVSGAMTRVGETSRAAFDTMRRQATLAAAAIGGVGAAVFALANSTAQDAVQIGRFATLANATAEEFQRMAAAAETVGIENDKLADILKDMNDRVGDFLSTGAGPMADFFENIGPKIGVTIDDFRELSGPEALQLYVSSLERANVSQQEMTFYMEAMASDSTLLLPLLRDNGAEMNRLADSAESVGRILSNETITAANDFSEAMTQARGSLTGVRNIIGSALIPIVADLGREFTAFVADNRPLIEDFAASLSKGLRDALPVIGEILTGLGKVAGVVGDLVVALADLVGGWENLGIVVGVLFAAPAILAIGRVVAAITGLLVAIARVGPAMAAAATAVDLSAGRMNRSISRINIGGIVAAGQMVSLGMMLPDDVSQLGAFQDRNAAAMEGAFRSVPGLSHAMEGFEAARDWFHSGEAANNGVAPVQATPGGWLPPVTSSDLVRRAVGGAFNAGPLLVGEQGPELRFENRAGYIATAQQTRDLLRSGGGGRSINVGGITINGVTDPRAVAAEVMRAIREAERSALYDGAYQ